MKLTESPVAVEARFDVDGAITPLALSWRGEMLRIGDVGRSWTAADGQLLYWLVMVPPLGTLELCLDTTSLLWRVTRAWEHPAMV